MLTHENVLFESGVVSCIDVSIPVVLSKHLYGHFSLTLNRISFLPYPLITCYVMYVHIFRCIEPILTFQLKQKRLTSRFKRRSAGSECDATCERQSDRLGELLRLSAQMYFLNVL